jgi:hypothetical protein
MVLLLAFLALCPLVSGAVCDGCCGSLQGGGRYDSNNLCPDSTFTENTNNMCLDCPQGYFRPRLIPVSFRNCINYCFPCPLASGPIAVVGTPGHSSRMEACEDCVVGMFSVGADNPCVDCRPGYYSEPAMEKSRCKVCPSGTYGDEYGATNSSFCKVCPPARYQPAEAATNVTFCIECPVGQIGILPGQSTLEVSCSACEPVTGAIRRTKPGTNPTEMYQNEQGRSACKSCPVGRDANPARTACNGCDAGEFANVTGRVEGEYTCVRCPVGFKNAGRKTLEQVKTKCDECQKGEYTNRFLNIVCLDCPSGWYADQKASTECKKCEAGYYTKQYFKENNDLKANENCDVCPNGFTSSEQSGQCSKCEAGSYGHLCGDACVEGQYRAFGTNSTTNCIDCPVGFYTNTGGSGSCERCPLGKEQPTPGAMACIPCNPGKYLKVSDFCVPPCDPPLECQDCPTGYHGAGSGLTQCTKCSQGTTQSTPGGSNCMPCQSGTYMNEVASVQANCKNCPVGFKSSLFVQDSCQGCLLGLYQDQEEQSTCKECLAGTFSNVTSLVVCFSCPIGYNADSNKATICQSCLAGEFGSECETCHPGMFREASNKDVSTCVSCPSGFYQNAAGQASCLPCVPGKFSDINNQTACKLCDIGTFSNTTELKRCFTCGDGETAFEKGSASCTKCDAGKFGNNCTLCPAGQHRRSTDTADACTLCFAGQYQTDEGQLSCVR